MENKRQCTRCLLREFDQDGYLKQISVYVENLEPEIKAPRDLYESRLTVCSECARLMEGLCRACGCFVELRAAIQVNSCPYDQW